MVGLASALFAVGSMVYIFLPAEDLREPPGIASTENEPELSTAQSPPSPRAASRYHKAANLTLVWDRIKPEIRTQLVPTSLTSNIERRDYVGDKACVQCHKENHSQWSEHPHRFMNAIATVSSVRGDFSGEASMEYRGGKATFYQSNGKYRMEYQRADLHRIYEISQTIGSRFYQYYVGKGIEGPEPKGHAYYREEFVLPFGYWLSKSTWVPIVHVGSESHEEERWDSLEDLKPHALSVVGTEGVGVGRGIIDHSVDITLNYARACNYCHTTFALGEMLNRIPDHIGKSLPQPMFLEQSTYLAKNHSAIWDGRHTTESQSLDDLTAMSKELVAMDAPTHAAALGINCEACHLGCQQHTQQKEELPAFAPKHPDLFTHRNNATYDVSKTTANLNAICARCHAGDRPTYAAGMSTWNSTEWTDAKRGACYSQLTCVKCHNPHQAIGEQWNRPPKSDDDICLSCHQKFVSPDARQLHTHHRTDSEGDRCMNCHMPKINEGIQDVVRTHTIFSPTNAKMLQANHPNACNLCHLDKSVRWTAGYLSQWYNSQFKETEVAHQPSQSSQPEPSAGLAWLSSSHDATRLVSSAAFAREGAKWGLPNLVRLLDDPILTNRQFAQQSVERLADRDLNKEFGYWFYMTPEERKPIIERIQESLQLER